jgi:hypothetical protein
MIRVYPFGYRRGYAIRSARAYDWFRAVAWRSLVLDFRK